MGKLEKTTENESLDQIQIQTLSASVLQWRKNNKKTLVPETFTLKLSKCLSDSEISLKKAGSLQLSMLNIDHEILEVL